MLPKQKVCHVIEEMEEGQNVPKMLQHLRLSTSWRMTSFNIHEPCSFKGTVGHLRKMLELDEEVDTTLMSVLQQYTIELELGD